MKRIAVLLFCVCSMTFVYAQQEGVNLTGSIQSDMLLSTQNKDDATRASNSSGGSLITHMTPEMIMQYLGIFTDSKKIEDLSFTANIVLPEVSYVLVVKNGVILYEEGSLHDEADTTWTTTRQGLFAIAQNDREGVEKLVTQDGDTTLLEQLLAANTAAEKDMYFNIVEP